MCTHSATKERRRAKGGLDFLRDKIVRHEREWVGGEVHCSVNPGLRNAQANGIKLKHTTTDSVYNAYMHDVSRCTGMCGRTSVVTQGESLLTVQCRSRADAGAAE